MESILEAVWLQYGALGLLSISGYVLWWLERKERMKLAGDYYALFEITLESDKELRILLSQLVEGLSIKEMLTEYGIQRN